MVEIYRNRALVTEEEAFEKQCHRKIRGKGSYCVASVCMAWAWHRERQVVDGFEMTSVVNGKKDQPSFPDGHKVQPWDYVGYSEDLSTQVGNPSYRHTWQRIFPNPETKAVCTAC